MRQHLPCNHCPSRPVTKSPGKFGWKGGHVEKMRLPPTLHVGVGCGGGLLQSRPASQPLSAPFHVRTRKPRQGPFSRRWFPMLPESRFCVCQSPDSVSATALGASPRKGASAGRGYEDGSLKSVLYQCVLLCVAPDCPWRDFASIPDNLDRTFPPGLGHSPPAVSCSFSPRSLIPLGSFTERKCSG